jgi:hypothetical protein
MATLSSSFRSDEYSEYSERMTDGSRSVLAATSVKSERHANATLLDAVGTPLGTVQALLGHSSSEITREVYLHSIPAGARAAVQKVEDLLIGPRWTQVRKFRKLEAG